MGQIKNHCTWSTIKFNEKRNQRETIQHNFPPQNSSHSSLRNLPFLRMFAFPIGGPKSKERNKHCWYVRNNDYLTAEKIREVSQLRLAVVDSSFFSFLFHTNPPTQRWVSPFHSFGKFPCETSREGPRSESRCSLPRRKS